MTDLDALKRITEFIRQTRAALHEDGYNAEIPPELAAVVPVRPQYQQILDETEAG